VRLRQLAATVLVACIALLGETATAARATIDPVGTWSCVVWGHPDFGDERVLFSFAPQGVARLARIESAATPAWSGLTPWVEEDRRLRFSDPRSGRQYTADLRRDNLGGTWRTLTQTGGWWCALSDIQAVPETNEARAAALPPVLPRVTATPRYPVEAIRAAKQGRVVTCFLVDSAGVIVQPEIIELSDEIFREPILSALRRSRYQGWEDTATLRPGCRSYTFKLDQIVNLAVE